jgi:hypothetical protein
MSHRTIVFFLFVLSACESAKILDCEDQKDKMRPEHHYSKIKMSDNRELVLQPESFYYDNICKSKSLSDHTNVRQEIELLKAQTQVPGQRILIEKK